MTDNMKKFLSLVSDEDSKTVEKNQQRIKNRPIIRKARMIEVYGDKDILYTYVSENIGQVKIEDAQQEVDRLNKQWPNTNWRIDTSPEMCELDADVCQRIELSNGYVWVTCTNK